MSLRRMMMAGGPGGPPTDPNFANVVSLLHFNGPDGSTTFGDVKGKVWTAAGNAQIDTAQSKFGGSSLLLDGSGDYIETSDSSDFAFGSGDFTVEGWFRESVTGVIRQIIGQHTTAAGGESNSSFLVLSDSGKLTFQVFIGGTYFTAANPSSHATDTWHHFAAVRDGGTCRLFLNGTQVATAAISGSLNDSTRPVTIGAVMGDAGPNPGGYYFNGHIDDLRITKGVARYTAAFTPPSAAFPDS